MLNPKSKHNRNLHAVNAHFRRGGAIRDSRIAELERVALLECEEALDEAADVRVREMPR